MKQMVMKATLYSLSQVGACFDKKKDVFCSCDVTFIFLFCIDKSQRNSLENAHTSTRSNSSITKVSF